MCFELEKKRLELSVRDGAGGGIGVDGPLMRGGMQGHG